MAEFNNIQIAEKLFDAINAHDLDLGDSYLAVDYKFEGPGTKLNGGALNRDQARVYNQGFMNAFPDLHFDINRKIAQGEYVVINWVASGTHTGPLPTPTGDTLPATGKKSTDCEIINIVPCPLGIGSILTITACRAVDDRWILCIDILVSNAEALGYSRAITLHHDIDALDQSVNGFFALLRL